MAESFIIPEENPADHPAAGFAERFIAYLIDILPFVILKNVTFKLFLQKNGMLYNTAADTKWTIAWIVIFISYVSLFTAGGRVTAGKAVLGLRVDAAGGGEIDFARALLRSAGYFLSSAPAYLGYLMAFFTPGKRALHDYLAGTKVIRTRERSSGGRLLIILTAWAAFSGMSYYYCSKRLVSLLPSQTVKVESARKGLRLVAYLEEIHKNRHGFYTNDLNRLAGLSGNIGAFREKLVSLFTPDAFSIAVYDDSYVISGYARDLRKTKVELKSPPKK